jgi:hypothetical protein
LDCLRRNFPVLAILAVYLACILIADPRGEFPLNDDWSYTRSAFALGSGHGLKVDHWAAPSLIGQVLYGGLLAKIFSPSFLVLRVSTLVLSCVTLLLLWGIFLRTRLRRDLACVLLLAWAFNPLQFSLAFTYMTEIPFIFFIALALYLYILHLDSGSFPFLFLSAAVLGYAFLIRQTALFFILALGCSILVDARKSIWTRVRQLFPAAGTAGFFIAGYYVWVQLNGGSTPAVHRKFELLSHLAPRQIIGNSFGTLFYLAFMLLPVLIFLIPCVSRFMRGLHWIVQIGFPAVWSAIVIMGVAWFHTHYLPLEYLPSVSYHSKMPYLLNVLYDSGLGPVTLDPAYFGAPSTPSYPGVWVTITAIVAAGAVFAGTLGIFCLARLRVLPLFQKRKPLFVFAGLSILCLAGFEILFSHQQEGGLFDRHLLVVSFPLYILIGIFLGTDHAPESLPAESRRPVGALWIPAGIALLAMGSFCVAATHDYLEWNRIRWEMGRKLLNQGVDPLAIVGGFEFNAWNNYDAFVARGKVVQTSHWWYDRRDYVISLAPQDGYEVQEIRPYFSWVHRRPIPLYLMKKGEHPF